MSKSQIIGSSSSPYAVPSLVRSALEKVSTLLKSVRTNRHHKIVLTVSVGAICGISIAINYYFRLLSIRKKRVLNKSTLILEMVKNQNFCECTQSKVTWCKLGNGQFFLVDVRKKYISIPLKLFFHQIKKILLLFKVKNYENHFS